MNTLRGTPGLLIRARVSSRVSAPKNALSELLLAPVKVVVLLNLGICFVAGVVDN
jgi:hypothetical protein